MTESEQISRLIKDKRERRTLRSRLDLVRLFKEITDYVGNINFKIGQLADDLRLQNIIATGAHKKLDEENRAIFQRYLDRRLNTIIFSQLHAEYWEKQNPGQYYDD